MFSDQYRGRAELLTLASILCLHTPLHHVVFDPESRKFTDQLTVPSGHPLDLGLQNGPDGKIYGFTNSCIYRLDPTSLHIEVVIQGDFAIAGPIQGQYIYFATGHILRAAKIFQ